MKFLLTIMVCSVVTGDCIDPSGRFEYKNTWGTHYGCVDAGMTNSYKLLFDGQIFPADVVETYKLYPRFFCEKISVPSQKPQPEEPA